MDIQELRLHTRNLEFQRAFFAERMGIAPVEHTEQRLSFQIGRTALVFEPNPEWDGLYHYAFQIPEHQFDEAVAWLSQRCTLLENGEGQQVFHFDIWNAHAVYFADGDRNIAELIAHHDLETPSTGPFGAGSILGVNEIGLVVDDVPATVQHLAEAHGLSPYRDLLHPEFTAVGDSEGRFIVVTRRRPWLPTGQPATPGWFSAVIRTPLGRQTYTAPSP